MQSERPGCEFFHRTANIDVTLFNCFRRGGRSSEVRLRW
jgi:hypothetical protein